MNVTINNTSANTTGYFELTEKATENSVASTNVVVPFTVSPKGKTTVTLPVGDTYDANIVMVFNNKTQDMLYMADGIWGTSSDNNTTVSQFNVSNNNNKQYSANEYPLLRDVQVQATTPTYLTIYKYLKGGAAAADLSGYKTLKFTTAASTGGLNLRVTITKQSIAGWNKQYSYLITNFQDGQNYQLSLSKFGSADSTLPALIDMSDITSVVYNIENPSGQTVSFTAGISNASFTKEDLVYEKSLEVKAVSIIPNPNNGNFRVSFASPAAAQMHLVVVDNMGRMINSQQINTIAGKNEVSINLPQSLISSVYYLFLQGVGVRYNTQKVIIKR
jgi:hypothetical protein